jgi:hypothetical protein
MHCPVSVQRPEMPPCARHDWLHPVGLQARSSAAARGDATACDAPKPSAAADPAASSQRPIRPFLIVISRSSVQVM